MSIHTVSCQCCECTVLSVGQTQNDSYAATAHDNATHSDSITGDALCLTTVKKEHNQSELCSSQIDHKFLESTDKDHSSSQTESTDNIIGNGNNPDIVGNSTSEVANDGDLSLSVLQRWQKKYPDRKIEPHTCTTCGQQFLQSVQLRKHMIKHAVVDNDDGVEFPYTCYVCRRHFLFANDLRRHLVSHSSDRPYSCVVCTRPFKREDDLTKHLKLHGDVRPYRCEECSEQLESTSKLRRHMRKVHGDRFECRQCNLFFARRSLLSKHRRELHAGLSVCPSVSVSVCLYLCLLSVCLSVYESVCLCSTMLLYMCESGYFSHSYAACDISFRSTVMSHWCSGGRGLRAVCFNTQLCRTARDRIWTNHSCVSQLVIRQNLLLGIGYLYCTV